MTCPTDGDVTTAVASAASRLAGLGLSHMAIMFQPRDKAWVPPSVGGAASAGMKLLACTAVPLGKGVVKSTLAFTQKPSPALMVVKKS